MNDRLKIASRLLAGDAASEGYWESNDKTCSWALKLADTLIKLEQETRPKEEKEEVLWMTKAPEVGQVYFFPADAKGKYFQSVWRGLSNELELLKNFEVFESEDKIKKFLKLVD